jgi:hypothetical protein
MKHLISFNESFRVESIKRDVVDIFYSEVESEAFKIYCGDAWRGELVFTVQKEEEATFTLVKTFKLGELEEFITRLFLWADGSHCSMVLSYMDRVSFTIIKKGDLDGLAEDGERMKDTTVDKLIIRLRVFD